MISLQAFDKCAISVYERGSCTLTYETPWPTFLQRSNEGQIHEKHYFGSIYICRAKYLANLYFNVSEQALGN